MKKLKGKKLQPTLILEEAEEAIDELKKEDEIKLQDIVFPEEKLEITPVKKRKTRKQREKKTTVNPLGKRGTRKKVIPEFQIEDREIEIFN